MAKGAPKGHPRYGGRGKGIPNRRTQSLLDKCESRGIDPFDALLELAEESKDPGMRLAALKEICQYIYPKRKALEHSGSLEIDRPLRDLPPAELLKQLPEAIDILRKQNDSS